MTAEFAMLVPAVVLLLGLCLSALQVGALQLRLQDAAALAARSIARGSVTDSGGIVPALVRGASLGVDRRSGLVCARLTIEARVFGGLVAGIPLSATSCSPTSGAEAEPKQ